MIFPMIRQLLLSLALTALVRPVTANSSSSCTSVTITSQADADSAFSDCEDIKGSVTISSSAAGTLNLENLQSVSEDLKVEDTGLVGLTAPDLQNVGGGVKVTGNDQLNRLQLDDAQTVGGDITVQDNKALTDLRMDNLQTVRGKMDLDGGFNTLSFENLERVNGESSIVSTGSAGCSGIDRQNAEEGDNGDVFTGSYSCATTTPSPSSSPSSSSSSSPSSSASPTDDSGSGLSGGAIAGIVIGVVVAIIIALILLWLCLRQRRKNRAGATGAGVAALRDAEKQQLTSQNQPSSAVSPNGNGNDHGAPIAAAAIGRSTSGTERGVTGAAGTIPRRPVSTAFSTTTAGLTSSTSPSSTDPSSGPSGPSSSGLPSSLTAGSAVASSMPVPTSLIPGTSGPGNRNTISEGDALFFNAGRTAPRRRPSESDVPMLDSGDVHEVPAVSVAEQEGMRSGERVVGEGAVFELDGGFEGARHQRAIHGEGGSNTAGG